MAKKYKGCVLGIDVGASGIRGVVFDGRRVLKRHEYTYPHRPRTRREFWTALFGIVDTLLEGLPKNKVGGIGLGMPAAIEKGHKAWRPGNLNVIDELEVYRPLKQKYHTKISVTNDAKAAALAEYRLGAGARSTSMLMITLGSGTGCGYIKDGTIQGGAFTTAYEVNNMIVEAAKSLRSKKDVTLEDFASEKFFLRRGVKPLEAARKARLGDKKMQGLWRTFGAYLGIILSNFIVSLEPQVIVLSGSMAQAWPLFAPSMRHAARRFVPVPVAIRRTKILPAKLGNDAGAIGAALLVRNPSPKKH